MGTQGKKGRKEKGQRKRTYALFDFDGTITWMDSLTFFLIFVARERVFTKLWPALTALLTPGKTRDERKEGLLIALFRGMPTTTFTSRSAWFAQTILPRIVRKRTRRRMEWHHARGDHVVVVSASPSAYLAPWARQAGIDRIIATEMRLQNKDGHSIVDGSFVAGNIRSKRKATIIDAFLKRTPGKIVAAYGDSPSDKWLARDGCKEYYRSVEDERAFPEKEEQGTRTTSKQALSAGTRLSVMGKRVDAQTVLFTIVAVAFLLRIIIAIAAQPYVENLFDIRCFRDWGMHIATGNNPYINSFCSNYPPLWHLVMGSLTLVFGSGMAVVIPYKVFTILADLGIIILIYALTDRLSVQKRLMLAGAYAIHPLALIITGVHGQIDSVMLYLILLAIHFLRKGRDELSALALGLGIAAKVVPVFLVPLLLIKAWRRWRYLIITGLPTALMMLPFLFPIQEGVRMIMNIAGGRGGYSQQVLGAVLHFLLPEGIVRILSQISTPLLLCAVIGTAFLFRKERTSTGVLAALLVFFAITPVWAPQYLLWLVPIALLSWNTWNIGYAVIGTITAITYYLSNLLKIVPIGPLTPEAVFGAYTVLITLTWVYVVVWLCTLMYQIINRSRKSQSKSRRLRSARTT